MPSGPSLPCETTTWRCPQRFVFSFELVFYLTFVRNYRAMMNLESTPVSRWEPTPRWERRYREVLDVAATAFAEKGYLGASTKDIADRLGIRAASLYYYFPSKEAALAAICEFGVRDFIAHLRDILAKPVSSAEKLRA